MSLAARVVRVVYWLQSLYLFFFFFQAEDGIRDTSVTGVQTCALPISRQPDAEYRRLRGFGPCGPERAETPVGIGDPLHPRRLAYRSDWVYPLRWPISRGKLQLADPSEARTWRLASSK